MRYILTIGGICAILSIPLLTLLTCERNYHTTHIKVKEISDIQGNYGERLYTHHFMINERYDVYIDHYPNFTNVYVYDSIRRQRIYPDSTFLSQLPYFIRTNPLKKK